MNSLLFLLVLSFLGGSKAYTCDEAQCRGRRAHPWVLGDTEYTCWVQLDVTAEELADPANGYCTEGYIGKLVDEDARLEVDGEIRRWYTCCPSDFEGEALRTCSDTTCSSPDWAAGGNCWADGFQEPMSCGTRDMRHPRYTGLQSLIYIQFLCCDSPASNDSFMQELLVARIIWVLLSAITLVACTVFVAGILASQKARSQGYNMYLVFLAVPDALANIMVLVRNGLSIPGAPVSPNVYIFLASFEYFYAAANMWLNAVIISQIHRVLQDRFTTSGPPTVRLACLQAAVTYFLAALAFGWAFFMYHNGLLVFSLTTVVNIWISTRGLLAGPPLLYVLGVCFDVWYRKLLPISGRTRVVALYFLRVVIVFLVTWVPYFIIYDVAWNITFNRWQINCSYYLGSIQGLISVAVAMSKPDVKKAVQEFVTCQFPDDDGADNQTYHGGLTVLGRMWKASKTSGTMQNSSRREEAKSEYEDDISSINEWNEDDVWERAEETGSKANMDVVIQQSDHNDDMEAGQSVLTNDINKSMRTSTRPNNSTNRVGDSMSESARTARKDDEWVNDFMSRVRAAQDRRVQRLESTESSDSSALPAAAPAVPPATDNHDKEKEDEEKWMSEYIAQVRQGRIAEGEKE